MTKLAKPFYYFIADTKRKEFVANLSRAKFFLFLWMDLLTVETLMMKCSLSFGMMLMEAMKLFILA
jgi:hypothetical protein